MKTLSFKSVDFIAQTLSIGVFDGIHKGHLEILSKLLTHKNPAVITFNPHPRKGTKLIMRFCERLRMFKKLGIERVYVIAPRDKIFEWSAMEFIEKILQPLKVEKIIVGSDFRLGHDRCTDVYEFKALCLKKGIAIDIIDTVMDYVGHKLSSTDIRKAISVDDVKHAKDLLGSNYFITGMVRKGSGIASGLGFKTMNIKPASTQLMPGTGVYKTKVLFTGGEVHDSVTYVGNSPTLKQSEQVIIETHIPDFDQKMYGKKIRIFFKEKLRNEYKFSSKEELIAAIKKDVSKVKF